MVLGHGLWEGNETLCHRGFTLEGIRELGIRLPAVRKEVCACACACMYVCQGGRRGAELII